MYALLQVLRRATPLEKKNLKPKHSPLYNSELYFTKPNVCWGNDVYLGPRILEIPPQNYSQPSDIINA